MINLRTVIFWDTSPLILRDIERSPNGEVKSGTVVNGAWYFEVRKGECLAKNEYGHIVTRWPKPDTIPEIKIPDGIDIYEYIDKCLAARGDNKY